MTSTRNDTARQLLQVTMMLMRSLSSRMRQGEQGLTPAHVGILARVSEAPCTLSELARHQCVRLPTMSRSVSMLVEKGLVLRSIPEQNRRQTMVSLTDKGKQSLAAMKKRAQRHVAAVLAPLNASERNQVHTGLAILARTLAPADPSNKRGAGR